MTTEEEIESLKAEIEAAELAIHPKKKRLTELYQSQGKDIDGRIKRREPFAPDELNYSAYARCKQCDAGLAYPKRIGPWGDWYCSAELISGERGHDVYPFAMYEIKSEQQASANGNTTRPK